MICWQPICYCFKYQYTLNCSHVIQGNPPHESGVSVAFNKDWMVMCEQDSDWKAEQGNEARRWGRIDARDGPLHCSGSHLSPRLYMPLATETGPKVYSYLIHMLLSLNVFDHRSKTF